MIILPVQGENLDITILPQGVAVGLGYIGLSALGIMRIFYINKFLNKYFFCSVYFVNSCFSIFIFSSMADRIFAIFCCSSIEGK
jgi:hypothetical protein